ncbi:MAG: glycosyltransferase family 2 protein [Phycisphaerae bacterium]|jgi:hypothetical protein
MTRVSQPTVSVIVPTYNRKGLLPRALDSIIAQTVPDWEIVLVDDGSTDGTECVAAAYADRLGDRLVYIRQKNRGASAARNTGIDSSRGRYIAFLDSDDEFLPNKLERQLAMFELRPELGFVYCDYAFIDLEGRRHASIFDTVAPLAREVECESVASGLSVCTGNLFDVLLRGYFIPTIVGMVRREVLGTSIRYPPERAYAEEWLFYLKVVRACRAGFVDESLCLHHFTAGSLARTDRHQNSVGMREILLAIRRAFGDLRADQRRTVDRQLAAACRQLGYEAYRQEQYDVAMRRFWEGFRREPRVDVLVNLVESAFRRLLPSRALRPAQPITKA